MPNAKSKLGIFIWISSGMVLVENSHVVLPISSNDGAPKMSVWELQVQPLGIFI